MRTIVLLVGLLALAGCKSNAVKPPAPPPANADHTVTMTWSQNEADAPVCSSTVTTSCLSGYSEGYVTGTTFTPLHTDTMGVCTGTTEPLSCTTTFQSAVVPIGSVSFAVVLDYANSAGTASTLAAVTEATPTTVAADAPTALAVTVQ